MQFSLAVGGIECVAAHTRGIGAVGHGTLLDQSNTSLVSGSEAVGGFAGTGDSVLSKKDWFNLFDVNFRSYQNKYLNSVHKSVVAFAEFISGGVVYLKSSGQAFLEIDRPFNIAGISFEFVDLYQSMNFFSLLYNLNEHA